MAGISLRALVVAPLFIVPWALFTGVLVVSEGPMDVSRGIRLAAMIAAAVLPFSVIASAQAMRSAGVLNDYMRMLNGLYEVASQDVKAAVEATYRAALADGVVTEDEFNVIREMAGRVEPGNEVSERAYADISIRMDGDPSVKAAVREAMKDGRITTSEYVNIVDLEGADDGSVEQRAEDHKEALLARLAGKEPVATVGGDTERGESSPTIGVEEGR